MVKYVYNAWGAHKVLSPDGTEITELNHIGNLNPHRYRGYYYSTALELYYLKSRFYDAEIGRFICADSLDYLNPHTVGGLNLFAYCNNNPVMNVDPTGHAWWEWALAGVAVAACVAGAVFTGGASLAGVALIGAAVGGTLSIATQAVEAIQTETDDFSMAQFVGDVAFGAIGGITGGGAVSAVSSAVGAGVAALTVSTEVAVVGGAVLGAGLVALAQTPKRGGYYGERWPGDPHKPDHVHLRGNKTDIRIGRDGNPLPGEKKLNAQARKALEKLWDEFVKLFEKW